MDTQADPIAALPNTLDTSRLGSLDKPSHEVLSDLVHQCSTNPATRTTAAAALVLNLWQLRGRALTQHVPSAILLNAAEAAEDPIDELSKRIVRDGEANRSSKESYWGHVPIRPEDSERLMASAIAKRAELGEEAPGDPFFRSNAGAFQKQFASAREAAGFGSGYSRAYARAWHEQFGLITDGHDELILRLNAGPDRLAFRSDLLGNPERLLAPAGVGSHLRWTRKTISISGSLTADLWDEELVRGIVELGLPILFLPHVAEEPLIVPNQPAIDIIPTLWRDAPGRGASTSLPLPPVDWFDAHAKDVRRRLHALPGTGTYEFAVLGVLHQLGSVCEQIARFAGGNRDATPDQISALFWDLHTRAFRGIALGVAALAWHCLGFDPGCPRRKALKVLEALRAKGAMSRSGVRRSARLEKGERDLLLERLAAEDIVRVDGKTVTALTCAEFVAALHSREGLPQPANFAKLIADEGKASA